MYIYIVYLYSAYAQIVLGVTKTNLGTHRWSHAAHLARVDRTRRKKPASNPTQWTPPLNHYTPFTSCTIDLVAPSIGAAAAMPPKSPPATGPKRHAEGSHGVHYGDTIGDH
jgi:hypothetical protein